MESDMSDTGAQGNFDLTAITRRLDVIIGLLIDAMPEIFQKAEERTRRLAQAGLRANEIGSITGRLASNIRRDLSRSITHK